jgi:hypothetical protein
MHQLNFFVSLDGHRDFGRGNRKSNEYQHHQKQHEHKNDSVFRFGMVPELA